MLSKDYTMAAQIAADSIGGTVDAVIADPRQENGAYALVYDPAKPLERAYSTHWINLTDCACYFGHYDMGRGVALQDLIERI